MKTPTPRQIRVAKKAALAWVNANRATCRAGPMKPLRSLKQRWREDYGSVWLKKTEVGA
jgi:hypothetical protein